jgi:hypothetical protein
MTEGEKHNTKSILFFWSSSPAKVEAIRVFPDAGVAKHKKWW